MDGWVDVSELCVNIDVSVVRVCMLCVPLCCVFVSMLSVYLVCCVYLVCVWYDVWFLSVPGLGVLPGTCEISGCHLQGRVPGEKRGRADFCPPCRKLTACSSGRASSV